MNKQTHVISTNKQVHPIINEAKVVKFLKKAQKQVSDI
jgi:hypothetical protein